MTIARENFSAEFDCPHCDAGFTMSDDAIYVDDIEDKCCHQCSACGGWYQLQCVDVEVILEATKAPEHLIPNGKAQ
jgi:transcription elongation factor Elf1